MGDKVNLDSLVKAFERNRRISMGLPVPSIRSEIPCGYVVNPDNKEQAIIDQNKYNLLRQARKYLKESSFQEVSSWLTKSGLPISHNGLHKLMSTRIPYTDDERTHYNTTT